MTTWDRLWADRADAPALGGAPPILDTIADQVLADQRPMRVAPLYAFPDPDAAAEAEWIATALCDGPGATPTRLAQHHPAVVGRCAHCGGTLHHNLAIGYLRHPEGGADCEHPWPRATAYTPAEEGLMNLGEIVFHRMTLAMVEVNRRMRHLRLGNLDGWRPTGISTDRRPR